MFLEPSTMSDTAAAGYVMDLWVRHFGLTKQEARQDLKPELHKWRAFDRKAKNALRKATEAAGDMPTHVRAFMKGEEVPTDTLAMAPWCPEWDDVVAYGRRYVFVMVHHSYSDGEDDKDGLSGYVEWKAVPLLGVPFVDSPLT